METIEVFVMLALPQAALIFIAWRMARVAEKVLEAYKIKDATARETLSLTISQLVGSLKAATSEEAVASSVAATHDHLALQQLFADPAPKDAVPIEAPDAKAPPTLEVEGVGPVDLLAYDERDLNRSEG